MRYLKLISTLLFLSNQLFGQLHVQQNATLWIGSEASISVGGAVDNDGSIQNSGIFTFTGDWDNSAGTSVYNDNEIGSLEATGNTMQIIDNGDQQVSNLVVNNGEEVFLEGNTFLVSNELNLTSGIIRLGAGTSLVIGDNANIVGGSSESFIEGTIVQRGNGERRYPLGLGTNYLPLTLTEVTGIDVEMAVGIGFFAADGIVPQPDLSGSVIGVSDFHYWDVEVLSGTFMGSPVMATFEEATLDINSFAVRNPFNFSNSSVTAVYAPNIVGDYNTLNREREDIFDTNFTPDTPEATTFGTLITTDAIDSAGFIAIGLVADVPQGGIVYIPTAFSPSAFDPVDRTFKVFGEGITSDEGFRVAVYNSFGVEVYNTDDLLEASTVGWDGTYSGRDQPTGSYRYFVTYIDGNGERMRETGVLMLIR